MLLKRLHSSKTLVSEQSLVWGRVTCQRSTQLHRGPTPLTLCGLGGCVPNVRCDPHKGRWHLEKITSETWENPGKPCHEESWENDLENLEEQLLKQQCVIKAKTQEGSLSIWTVWARNQDALRGQPIGQPSCSLCFFSTFGFLSRQSKYIFCTWNQYHNRKRTRLPTLPRKNIYSHFHLFHFSFSVFFFFISLVVVYDVDLTVVQQWWLLDRKEASNHD